MPDAYAVRISAQVAFEIVRLTLEETLTQKLWGSKFDRPAVGWRGKNDQDAQADNKLFIGLKRPALVRSTKR